MILIYLMFLPLAYIINRRSYPGKEPRHVTFALSIAYPFQILLWIYGTYAEWKHG